MWEGERNYHTDNSREREHAQSEGCLGGAVSRLGYPSFAAFFDEKLSSKECRKRRTAYDELMDGARKNYRATRSI